MKPVTFPQKERCALFQNIPRGGEGVAGHSSRGSGEGGCWALFQGQGFSRLTTPPPFPKSRPPPPPPPSNILGNRRRVFLVHCPCLRMLRDHAPQPCRHTTGNTQHLAGHARLEAAFRVKDIYQQLLQVCCLSVPTSYSARHHV